MAIVVSDTSPIRALSFLGLLDLLATQFGQVIVPPAVVSELEHPPKRFTPFGLQSAPFIRVQAPRDRARVTQLLGDLDAGESEAIALAEELNADFVLIDELRGRTITARCGLTTIGVIGILLAAKQAGSIQHVRPLLDRLRSASGFFIADALYHHTCKLAGE